MVEEFAVAYEMMVGLQVKDREVYHQYREAMRPLLEMHGGGFRYDFVVSEVLKSATPAPINRVFAIYFGSEALKDALFANPEYKQIKQKYFETSVEATTILSSYERD